MNKEQIIYLYLDMGRILITFFDKILYSEDVNFDINFGEKNGYISDGYMSMNYIDVSDNEIIYVYHDNEGMICLNTNSLDKSFIKFNGKNYFGYKQFEKEPFDFFQKVTEKLNLNLEDEHSNIYHI